MRKTSKVTNSRAVKPSTGTFLLYLTMSFITAIGTANPRHKYPQSGLADFMVRAMKLPYEEERKLRAIFKMSGIETRYSVLGDYGKSSGFDFFDNHNGGALPTTRKRLDYFREHAVALSKAAIQACLSQRGQPDRHSITHLIVVSCTGMYAPGLDIDLVNQLELPSSVQRTCINFMGCYAAFNAIKLGHHICESEQARVLIVCTELCSLHFQNQISEDNFLANALFADGAAAMLMESKPKPGYNLSPAGFHCDLNPTGEQDMTWRVGDFGFEMRLSSYVPDLIKQGIGALTSSLLQRQPLSGISYFAIHPGGRKILEAIQTALGISQHDNQISYSVLRDFGNMSSPTVIFVLQRIMNQLQVSDHGKKILSFAFGPGLTLESMILDIENHERSLTP